jgi:signal transduction histidine kinase
LKEKLNHTIAGVRQVLKRMSLWLLVIVALASAAIIVVNYYSIRILSGARAYINGESQYSKGQKDASAALTSYIYLGKETDYRAFLENINVNRGDRTARIALSSPTVDYNIARRGFLAGRNHPKDLDVMMWMFVRFKDLSMFKKAIGIWVDGDALVNELYLQGIRAHQMMANGGLSADEKQQMLLSISNISQRLTVKEQAFSDTLGNISRKINEYIFLANVIIILVIVASSMASAGIMISNLTNSRNKIIEQNNSLQAINAGLDKFVYNVTHDLRSPVASLSGLIDLIDDETDMEHIRMYTSLMKESLSRQDNFIAEMLAFIKSKHTGVAKQECSLETIVDNVIALNSYKRGDKEVKIFKEISLVNIESDALKIQVILNNLVSNSIKYSDFKKSEQWVRVRTYMSESKAMIEVQDNGIGIRQKDQERIFDKFYLSGDNTRSTGIGLYLVKDAVTQLNGEIVVKSEPGVSSTFLVSLPC